MKAVVTGVFVGCLSLLSAHDGLAQSVITNFQIENSPSGGLQNPQQNSLTASSQLTLGSLSKQNGIQEESHLPPVLYQTYREAPYSHLQVTFAHGTSEWIRGCNPTGINCGSTNWGSGAEQRTMRVLGFTAYLMGDSGVHQITLAGVSQDGPPLGYQRQAQTFDVNIRNGLNPVTIMFDEPIIAKTFLMALSQSPFSAPRVGWVSTETVAKVGPAIDRWPLPGVGTFQNNGHFVGNYNADLYYSSEVLLRELLVEVYGEIVDNG